MSGLRSISVSCLLTLLCLAVGSPAFATQHPAHKHAAKPDPVTPAPPPPPGPLSPLTLAQTPAMAPQVTYQDGQLTIAAQNSTMGDILRALRTQTGATIDAPNNAPDRVIGHFGPGPARQVVAQLLNGSRYNYVMVGSAANPDALQHLVLTPKPSDTPQPVAQNTPSPGQNPYIRNREQLANGNDDQADDDNDSDNPPPNVVGQEGQEQPPDAGNQPPIKTPEQILQELQRQQQIQQQQMQQQIQQQQGQQATPQDASPPPDRQR